MRESLFELCEPVVMSQPWKRSVLILESREAIFYFYSHFSDICLEAYCCCSFLKIFFSLFFYSPLLSKRKVRDCLLENICGKKS